MLWLQPYPDQLLDELPARDADEPESVAVARETIELAYLVAVQHLAPRPRAVLILRDVLGWPAKDVAELLGDSVNSVNSALQRARAGMREHLPAERQDWTDGEGDGATRDLVRRFTERAWPRTWRASPPCCGTTSAARCRPHRACTSVATPSSATGSRTGSRRWGACAVCRPRRTGQPAIAFYLWQEQEGAYLPLTLDVLRVTGGEIAEIITFHDDQFPRFGLPERLPADGAG